MIRQIQRAAGRVLFSQDVDLFSETVRRQTPVRRSRELFTLIKLKITIRKCTENLELLARASEALTSARPYHGSFLSRTVALCPSRPAQGLAGQARMTSEGC